MISNPPAPSPHQLIAVAKLSIGRVPGLLLADDVGVGKTISAGYALSWLQSRSREAQWVLCPPTLVDKWTVELRDRFGFNPIALRSKDDVEFAAEQSCAATARLCYVAPYSRMAQIAALENVRISTLVLDEIHQLRNRDTQQWRFAHQIARKADTRLGLSATPINNALQDLASALELLLPTHTTYAWASLIPNLWATSQVHLLGAVTTRITKALGGTSFASRNIHNMSVTLAPAYLASPELHGAPSGNGYASLALRRLLVSSEEAYAQSLGVPPGNPRGTEPKLQQAVEILGSHPGQVVICAAFKATATALCSALEHRTQRPCFLLTGDTPPYERTVTIERFRQHPEAVIVITQVGSEGLDLQCASCLINYDMHWNPMQIEQRIGRVDRRGQSKASVEIYNLWVASSVDEHVLRALLRKTSQIAATPFAAVLGLEAIGQGEALQIPLDDEELAEEIGLARQTQDALARIGALAFDEQEALKAIGDASIACKALLDPQAAPEALEYLDSAAWASNFRATQSELLTLLSDLEN